MSLQVGRIITYMEELAPSELALDWDNSGLTIGCPADEVSNILVALNFTREVLEEALSRESNLILTHHPFLLNPVQKIRTDLPVGELLQKTLVAGISLYTAHTNLDIADQGVNQVLAEAFFLQDISILKSTFKEQLEKLVLFVPESHLEVVREAISLAGAGWIGNYSHCTFQVSGTGTFLPREGANPYIGEKGSLEKVSEVRLETIMPVYLRSKVLAAMFNAHPYEEVAFDLYPLANPGKAYGLGRVGELPEEISLGEFSRQVKRTLDVGTVKVVGSGDQMVKKVALCGGSGGDLVPEAVRAGADVLVMGDLKYHQAEEAARAGLAVIDAGHDATERPVVPYLVNFLQQKIKEDGYQNKVLPSRIETSYWKFV